MKFSKIFVILLAIVLTATAGTASAKKDELPEVTEDGLHRVANSKMAIVYAEPGAHLAQYQRVMLLEANVAFKKNWARDQRSSASSRLSVNSRDIEKIKNNLAQEFDAVFRKTLEDGGYEVVDQAAEDVLLVRPAIINLDVNAPDTMSAGRSNTYTSSAGEMTLYIEIYDSVTGDLIAKALDRKADTTRNGYYTWANSVTNSAAAKRILGGWASILLDALNEAKQ
jgi:hypothetical protein